MSGWTDDPLGTTTHIRSRHINELRRTVDARRAQAGMTPYPWSDGTTVGVNTHIRATHFTEIKIAIEQYTGSLGNWTAGNAPSPNRQVKVSGVSDLRGWADYFSAVLGAATGSVLTPGLFYGCDTNSNCFPCSTDFYIGEIGFGTTPMLNNFNAASAALVGCGRTYGYWFLYGPDTAGATTNDAAYLWGRQQADAASQAWIDTVAVCRVTVSGDVEFTSPTEHNGWNSTNTALNQNVWTGFYNQLVSSTTVDGKPKSSLNPGLYSLQSMWTSIMGGSFGIPPGTPVWSADMQQGCSSCDNSSPNCPSSFPSLPLIGGIAPSIWQYNQQPPCAADLNVASSLPS